MPPVGRALLLVTSLLALTGCAGGALSQTSAPLPTTAPLLALLSVDRTGGAGTASAALRVGPSDVRLPAVAALVPVPLPPSSETDDPACVGCLVYDVTAVLTDGQTASWHFPETRPPGPLAKLASWLATDMG